MRAVSEALTPYAWRALTPEMVSRLALAAINGHGAADAAPVTRHDVRIGVLVDFLAGCPWRSLTAGAVSRQLVTALDTWRQESQWLEIELRWLLDGDG
ncbi:hypothetical protein OG562_18170 [Streptomyces sp. NBC_01275]|uniref:hypothetical protein n=1 Tax=Streptomyces sp. NBC_01275 TaxID=2903807 RepID=UPI002250187E|nr:hypothetical protein [Streptomyces sp. NBC_01275]MCX4762866.1 hypothetical protein [Streptomyces sp. NBC_01275]